MTNLAAAVLFCSLQILSIQGADISLILDQNNVSTPLRESIRDKYNNSSIKIHVVKHMREYMEAKIQGFEDLTGGTVQIVKESTPVSWYDDVDTDIGGAGIIDLYSIFGNWIPTMVNKPGKTLMDITEHVRNKVGLDWTDIMNAIRSGVATYNKTVYGIPQDGDVIIMLYRKDLVEDVGLPTPHTWDDVMTIMDYYRGKDINNDGIEDFTNCFSTKSKEIASSIFWAIAASFLQTKGTSEGLFFDPESFQPKSATDTRFGQLLDIYKKLVYDSPYRDEGETGWARTLDLFQEGRCVLWFNYPGPTKKIVSNQEANNMTGSLVYAPLPGMACNNPIECPHKDNEEYNYRNVNHSPFLANGGLAFVVSDRSSEMKKQMATDFAFYISDPDISYFDVAFPGSFLDPLRNRHTAALQNPQSPQSQAFLEFGWEPAQLPMIQHTTEYVFKHKNYAMDLRIVGAELYLEQATVPHLQKHWSGNLTTNQTIDAITKAWNSKTEKYGLREQRAMYRSILGLPEYIEPPEKVKVIETSSETRWDIIIPVVTIVCVIVVLLLAVVVKQRHTIKYKTRDVGNAPQQGNISLIFTDIQGSTSLWDSSKTVMSQALEIHHAVIRKIITKHKAYEVKTIGDAFMIAVESADAAVRIANEIQYKLLQADWPIQLATQPSACVEYFPRQRDAPPIKMFNGLRVRIGVNCGEYSEHVEEGGEVQIKYDAVAKGYDYYGPAVNAAARIEDLGFGGQTLISREVITQLSDEVKDDSAITMIGEVDLRGCEKPMTLYQVLPLELKGRRFDGAIRRRDSNEESIVEASLVEDASMRSRLSLTYQTRNEEIDMEAPIESLTPIQLQQSLARVRKRLKAYMLRNQSITCSNLKGIEDDDDLSMSSSESNQKQEDDDQLKGNGDDDRKMAGSNLKEETISLLHENEEPQSQLTS